MEYKIFPFRDMFDNKVEHSMAQSYTLDEYIQLLTTHISARKKNTHAFIAGDFKQAPAAREADKRIRTVLVGQYPGTVGRYAENLISVNSICVDFDEDVTIEQTRERFKDFLHIGYTSYNHKLEIKGGVDRFRMVFPLEKEILPELIEERKNGLRKYFKGCDKSTFDLARLFYLPSYNPDNNIEPISWVNHGRFFDPLHEDIPVDIKVERNLSRPVGIKGGSGKPIPATINLYDLFSTKGLLKNHLGNGKYSVICPNYTAHSNNDTSGTVIWSGIAGERDRFKCQHSHCQNVSLRDMFLPEEFNQFCEREESIGQKLNKLVDDIDDLDEGPSNQKRLNTITNKLNELLQTKDKDK
jgi:hypothetical protein